MDVNQNKNILKNEEGQAIFELLVFLPIFLFLFVIVYNIGNSLNVSINQQKVTRRYFYFIQKGNSFLPAASLLREWKGKGFTYAGIGMMGFRDFSDGEYPVAPCVKFPSYLTGETDETCEDPTEGEKATSFLRIATAYGICGESFRLDANGFWHPEYSDGESIDTTRTKNTTCSLKR